MEKKAGSAKKVVDKKAEKPDNNDNTGIVTFDGRKKYEDTPWKSCKRDATGKVDYIGHYKTKQEANDACE